MTDNDFEWQDIFAPERICKVQIRHQLRVAADGTIEYAEKQIADAVILKDQRQQTDCGPQQVISLLLQGGNTKITPGDRVWIDGKVFEITLCESCCDLSGNVIAWKCRIS